MRNTAEGLQGVLNYVQGASIKIGVAETSGNTQRPDCASNSKTSFEDGRHNADGHRIKS